MNYGLGENLILSILGLLVVSVSYMLRNGENLGNFDAKSGVGIFIGYYTKSQAYRVYNQNSQVI